jgi:hypothetical protein
MNMGEFGAWDGTYPTIVEAVDVLLGQQVRSSEYGFFGWQFFTWDSEIAGGANRFWNAMDDGEQINIALAPAHRPDPDR